MLIPRSSAATTIQPTIAFFTARLLAGLTGLRLCCVDGKPRAREETRVIAMSCGCHSRAIGNPLLTPTVNGAREEVVIAAVSSNGEIHVHGNVCRMGVRGPASGSVGRLGRGALREEPGPGA